MTMVEGLQVDVSSVELKQIMRDRLDHHTRKAEAYFLQAQQLERSIAGIEDDLELGKVSGGTPIGRLRDKSREHRERESYFRFMIEHVVKDETYRLGRDDLMILGIQARWSDY
jgi:hypothetical protein